MHATQLDPSPRADSLVVADLVIDRTTGRVRRGTRRVRLTPREHAVLVVLARHLGEVVTRETLYREVWAVDGEPASNLVDATISHLRGKVDWGHRLRLIHTVRGEGYTLEPHLEEAGPRLVLGS